jgi:hypothetical protein
MTLRAIRKSLAHLSLLACVTSQRELNFYSNPGTYSSPTRLQYATNKMTKKHVPVQNFNHPTFLEYLVLLNYVIFQNIF